MRFRQVGFGAAPIDSEVQAAQDALNMLTQSQNEMKTVFNSLAYNCPALDPQLRSIIAQSDWDIDYIKTMFQSFLAGGLEIATLTDAVNGHLLANDDLVKKMGAYQCNTGVLENGQVGARPSGDGVTADPLTINNGSGSGTTGGGGSGSGTPSPLPLPPGPVEAGLGFGAWLLGGGLLAAMLFLSKRQKQKQGKKTTRRKPARKTTRRTARRKASRRRR